MEEDIDIEEHDVLDNPRVRQMLPDLDLSHFKTEIPDVADISLTTEKIEYEDDSSTLQTTSHQQFSRNLAFEEEVICSPTNNKIILGSKPCTDSIAPESPILASMLGYQHSHNPSNHPSLIFGTNVYQTIKTEHTPYDYPESNFDNDPNNFPIGSNMNEFQRPSSVIILGSKPNRPFNDRNVVQRDVGSAFVLLEDWGPRLDRSSCYCKECEILFPTRNSLDAHKMSAHSFLIALGSKTPENFVQTHNTARKSTATEPGSSKNKFCNRCSEVFSDDTSLIKHLYEHLPFDKFKCEKCDAVFEKQEELNIHVRFHRDVVSQEIDDDQSDGYLICHICRCHFKLRWRYLIHVTRMHSVKTVDTHNARQPFIGACPACNKMYDEASVNRLSKHIQEAHRDLYHMKVKTVSPIKLSEQAIPQPKLLKKLHAPPSFLSQKPESAPQAVTPAMFSYQCVKCKKLFSNYKTGRLHRNANHPELRNQFLLKKIVVSKPGKAQRFKKIADIPYDCIKDAPVPMLVLFKCDKCPLHFTSCSAATIHSKSCVKDKGEWECDQCRLPFLMFDKVMHQRQHVISDKFKVYVYTETLYGSILCKCPYCKLYLHEQEFWSHAKHGCLFSKEFVACTHCTFHIHPSSVETHKQWHNELQIDKADIVLLRYAKTKNGEVKKPRNLEKKLKKRKMTEDAAKAYQPPPKKIKETPLTMYYCSTCKCCMKAFKNSHKTGECGTYIGSKRGICKLCGLFVTQYSNHAEFHKRNPNVKLRDYTVISIREGREMKPPMPVYPRCVSCQVRFISKRALQRHECEDSYKTCEYCFAKFSDLAYKLHIPFHEYYVKKPAAKPMQKAIKVTYSKPEKTPAVPKDATDMPELLKKYELLTKTWNILYSCKACDLVTDSYGQTVEHSQNHLNGVDDKEKTVKKCHVCMLHFDETDFEKHRLLHLTNESVNRNSFTILTYDYTVLLADDWFKLFGKLPEKQKQQIVSRSVYSTHRGMKMRLIVDGPPEHTLYKCARCSKYVNPLTMPEHHMKAECNSTPSKLYCKLCHIPFVTKAAHDLHFVAHEDESRKTFRSVLFNERQPKINTKIKSPRKYHYYQCQKCQCCILLLSRTKTHICTYDKKKRCPKCNLFFSSTSIHIHDRLHNTLPKFTSGNIHITPFNSRNEGMCNPVYKCAKCNICYMRPKSLKYHFDKKHITCEQIECTICCLRFTSYSIKRHMAYHHGKFKCDAKNIGVKVLSNKRGELAYHEAKFRSNTRYTGVKGLSNKRAEKHLFGKIKSNAKNGIKEKSNKLVNKRKATSRCILKLNMKFYSKKLYKCTTCSKHFLGKKTLVSHFTRRKVNHTKEEIDRYTKCDICQLNFGPHSLTRHRHVHHDQMKLTRKDLQVIAMDDPEKVVVTKSPPVKKLQENLKKYKHYLYKCGKCHVHFISVNSLKCHLFRHITIRKKVCGKCGFIFSAASIRRHTYNHHTKLNLSREDFIVTTSHLGDSEDACDELKMDEANNPKKSELVEEEDADYEPESNEELSDSEQTEGFDGLTGDYKSNIDNKTESQKKPIAELERPDGVQKYIECEPTVSNQNETKTDSHDLTNVDSANENDPISKMYAHRLLYQCDVCSLAFVSYSSFQTHMNKKQHKFANIFKCCQCGLPFFSLNALGKHEYQHHNELGLKLKDMVIIHSNKAGYQDVEKHNATVYRCNKCTHYFLALPSFLEHVFYCDGQVLQSRKCSACDLVFSNKLFRANHNREHHKKIKLERKDFRIISDSDFFTTENVKKSAMTSANVDDKSSEYVGTENQDTSSIHSSDYINSTEDSCFSEQTENVVLEDVTASLKLEENLTIDVDNQLERGTTNSSLNSLDNCTSEEKSGNELSFQLHSNCLFKCLQCSTHFLKEYTLLMHRKKSSCSNGVSRGNCKICGLQFNSSILVKHRDMHHVKMKLALEDMRIVEYSVIAGSICSNSLFKCSTCHLHFIRMETAWYHSCTSSVTDETIGVRCRQCGYAFSRYVLKSHKYLHHEQMKLNREDFQIVLPKSKEPNATEDVDGHEIALNFEAGEMKGKKRPRTRKDNKSAAEDMTFVDISKYDHHLYKCSKCKVLFLVRNTLQRHVNSCGQVANRAPLIECDVCGLFFTSFALTQHKSIQHEKLCLQKDDFVILDETQLKDSAQDTDTGDSASKVAKKVLNDGKPKWKYDTLPRNFNSRPYKYSNRLYKCNICSLHHINKKTAAGHVHEPTSIVACPTCGLQFTQQTLLRHRYVHHQLRNLRLEDLQVINYQTGVVETVTSPNLTDTCDSENAESESEHSTLNADENSTANDDTASNEEASTSGNATKKPTQKPYTLSTDSIRKINLKAYNDVLYQCNTCQLHFLNYTRIKYHIFSCENVVENKMECSVCGLTFAYITLAKHMYIHHKKKKLTKDDIRVVVLRPEDEEMPDIRANSLSIRDKPVNIRSSSDVVEILQTNRDVEMAPVVVDNIDVLDGEGGKLETITLSDNEEANTEAPKSPMQVPNIELYDNKLYKCNICSVHFFKYGVLESHIENGTHGTLKKKCDFCKLEFTIVALSTHVYVHHSYLKLNLEDFEITSLPPPPPNINKDVKLYKCGECNVHFLTQATCYKHITKHKKFDTKEYIECKLCGFQFRVISLHKHMLVHHAEDFELDNVLVEEYHPNILKNGTPKLDIYYAKDKVQSRLVSTTSEISNVDPDTTVTENIAKSSADGQKGEVDTKIVTDISDVTSDDNQAIETINSGVESEFVTNYCKNEEYTADISKSDDSYVTPENYDKESGVVANFSDNATNSNNINQNNQINAANSNDIDQINQVPNVNFKNENIQSELVSPHPENEDFIADSNANEEKI